jgi:hypothetical protein
MSSSMSTQGATLKSSSPLAQNNGIGACRLASRRHLPTRSLPWCGGKLLNSPLSPQVHFALAHQRSPTVHRLEQRVEYEYRDFLHTRCQHERKRQRQVNTWDREKARTMELKHCDELAKKWKGNAGYVY